jgi:hypothetical protein
MRKILKEVLSKYLLYKLKNNENFVMHDIPNKIIYFIE